MRTSSRPIILFGTGTIAEVILFYYNKLSNQSIELCCVDRNMRNKAIWKDLEVQDFEDIEKTHPPEEYDMFIALGYNRMNKEREKKFYQAKEKGYHLVSFIDEDVRLQSEILHGENCFVMSGVFAQPSVTLGNNNFVWSGAVLGHHSVIDNNCWLASSCKLGGNSIIRDNCFLGMNSVICDSIEVKSSNYIGANSFITKTTRDGQVFIAERTKPIRLDSSEWINWQRN